MTVQRVVRVGVTVVLVCGAVVGLPARALASTSCDSSQPSGHCYGIMYVDNATSTERWGANVKMFSSDLCFADDDYAFANEEIWADTNGYEGMGEADWVESGIQADRDDAGVDYEYYFFWADSRPGLGYSQHNLSTPYAELDTDQAVHIDYLGGVGNQWHIYDVGTLVGTSTNNPGPTYGAQAGLEVRYAHTDVSGKITDSYHRVTGGSSNVTGWNNGTLGLSSSDASVSWNTSSHTGISNSYEGPDCAGGDTDSTQPTAPPTMSTIEAEALRFAAANGDDSPTSADAVTTTRGAALSDINGGTESVDSASDSEPVVATTMTGSFLGNTASVPTGGIAPTGTDLTVLFDQNNGQITDWFLGNTPVDLSKLGTPTPFGNPN